jgi:hypothetical protein
MMWWGSSALVESVDHFTRRVRSRPPQIRGITHLNTQPRIVYKTWHESKEDRHVSMVTLYGNCSRADTDSSDAPGATYLAYTPNGKKLITAGVDNYCRIFSTGSDDEPITVDNCQEDNTAIVAGVSRRFLNGRKSADAGAERLLHNWIRGWHSEQIYTRRQQV